MQDIEAGYWCNIKNNWANASLFFLQSGRRHPDCNFFFCSEGWRSLTANFFLQSERGIPECNFFFAVKEWDPDCKVYGALHIISLLMFDVAIYLNVTNVTLMFLMRLGDARLLLFFTGLTRIDIKIFFPCYKKKKKLKKIENIWTQELKIFQIFFFFYAA